MSLLNLFKRKSNKSFSDAPDTAVFTTKFVLDENRTITYVTHDADDGAWQFFSDDEFENFEEVARIVALKQIIDRDETLLELAELPLGYVATRNNRSDKWKVSKMNANQPNREELPEPWYWTDVDLNDRLASETGINHILYGKKVLTLARREDNDDVLYEVFGMDFKYAVVHLTWSNNNHADGRWPMTETYKDWQDVYDSRLVTDHQDYQ